MSKFNVGDKVIAKSAGRNNAKNVKGVVVELNSGLTKDVNLVEFGKEVEGHDGYGRSNVEVKNAWYLSDENLELVKREDGKKMREVKREAKVGEKIKIVDRHSNSDPYKNGEILIVREAVESDCFHKEYVFVKEYNAKILTEEYVVIEEDFTLADLKPCMVVELRNGDIYLVSEYAYGKGIQDGNSSSLYFSDFKDDMTYDKQNRKHYDIMTVYGFRKDFMMSACKVSAENRELLWQRIEKSATEIQLEELEKQQRELADKIAEVRKGL